MKKARLFRSAVAYGCIVPFIFFVGVMIGVFVSKDNNDINNFSGRLSFSQLSNDKAGRIRLKQNAAGERFENLSTSHVHELRGHNDVKLLSADHAVTCDRDCRLFHQSLAEWPDDKPKAAIYYLTRYSRFYTLKLSLTSVERFFNSIHRYPIIMFHEGDLDSPAVRQQIRSYVNSPVYFQSITWKLPPFVNRTAVPVKLACGSPSIGYRHMCRFHALGIYQQPILTGLEYVWRLDDDSYLLNNVTNNVFETMRNGNFLYGYMKIVSDSLNCTAGLWTATRMYVEWKQIKAEFFSRWKEARMFYNNFEISALSLWMSPEYQDYARYIDHLGGIYYKRWGDAPIKSLAVSLFVPWSRIHVFSEIRYQHKQSKDSVVTLETFAKKPDNLVDLVVN